jgi:hypothetical protein
MRKTTTKNYAAAKKQTVHLQPLNKAIFKSNHAHHVTTSKIAAYMQKTGCS